MFIRTVQSIIRAGICIPTYIFRFSAAINNKLLLKDKSKAIVAFRVVNCERSKLLYQQSTCQASTETKCGGIYSLHSTPYQANHMYFLPREKFSLFFSCRVFNLRQETALANAVLLGPIDTFLGNKVAYRLSKPSLSKLTRHKSIYPVLKVVDLLVARYFGLVEVVCTQDS